MTVRISYDECRSWRFSKLLYGGPSAHSDLAVTSYVTICSLYERGVESPYERITFANFNVEWLTRGLDHLDGEPSYIGIRVNISGESNLRFVCTQHPTSGSSVREVTYHRTPTTRDVDRMVGHAAGYLTRLRRTCR